VSPVIFAHFLYFARGPRLRSCIDSNTRRCEGFSPSRTSGKAREMITLIA
jgi:hypothetical protein